MKKINIEGMGCEHCVNSVKAVLEGLGATSIEVSLEGAYATAEISASDEEIKNAIEDEGYDVTGIE